MTWNFKGKTGGEKAALVGAALSVLTAAGHIIYGLMYEQYADCMVPLCLLAGAALLGAYAIMHKSIANWLTLLGVLVGGFGWGLMIVNSYNVWADTWGNLQQYGRLWGDFNFFNSQGGPIPAVILIALGLAAVVCGVVSCFAGKEAVK